MTFIPDRSVTAAKDDRLNRAPFAYRLADTIRDWNRDESIVIGLYGAWGSGKTSVLHFAVERLQETTKAWKVEEQPIVIWFNPWSFSEQEKLLQAFFQQIYAEINKVDPKAGKDLKQSIKKFAQVLGALEPIPAVGQILSGGGKFVELFISDKSLEETKNEVAAIFKKLNRRILILIDDVDRLNREQIRLLFQLIKINADFPNTIYLVAFDRPVVETALTNEQGVSGREYLEKIVQVGFDVPSPDSALLQDLFVEEIDKILQDVHAGEWDQDRWAKLYFSGFNSFFQSVRDIKRFINSLGMTVSMVKSDVDAIDFIGLESLRVFMPEIYKAIAVNKNLFTSPQQALSGGDRLIPKIKEALEAIFGQEKEHSEIARKICTRLFPALESIYGNVSYSNESWLLWRKQKRICHKDNFDVYFLLGTPKGAVSNLEADEFLSQATDESALVQKLDEYFQENRYRKLLDRITDRADTLEPDQIKILCQALFRFGDTVPDIKERIPDIGSDLELTRLIRFLMFKLKPDERFTWFCIFLENDPPLYGTIDQVLLDRPREGKPPRTENLFSDEGLEQLRQICVRNIETRSENQDFLNQKEFRFILYRWRDWSSESQARTAFLARMQATIESFLSFAFRFLNDIRSQTSGSYIVETNQEFDSRGFFEFIDREVSQKFIEKLTEEELKPLSREQLVALKALSDSLSKAEANTES